MQCGDLQTKILRRCTLICFWRRYCARGAQYLRRVPDETQVEAWEGRIFTRVPTTWVYTVAEGRAATVSSLWSKMLAPPSGVVWGAAQHGR